MAGGVSVFAGEEESVVNAECADALACLNDGDREACLGECATCGQASHANAENENVTLMRHEDPTTCEGTGLAFENLHLRAGQRLRMLRTHLPGMHAEGRKHRETETISQQNAGCQ